MTRKVKLSVKVRMGFGVVMLLLATVGYAGHHSLIDVIDSVQHTEELSQLIKEVLEARRQEKNFMIRRDEVSIIEWEAAVNNVKKLATSSATTLQDPGQINSMKAVYVAIDKYQEAFSSLVNETKQENDLAVVWRGVGEEFVRLSGQAAKKVMEPGRIAAAEAKDQEALACWTRAETSLDQDVIRAFLLVRISAIYFLMHKSDKEWYDVQKNLATLNQGLQSWREMVKDQPALANVCQEIAAAIDRYQQNALAYHDLFMRQRQSNAAILDSARLAIKESEKVRGQLKSQMSSRSGWAKWFMIVATIGGVLLGMALALLMTRAITRPVIRIASELNEGAAQVAGASGEVLSSSQSLAGGACQQAAALEQTAAALEELADMTKNNAHKAQQARNLTEEAGQVMQAANHSMSRLTVFMDEITTASREVGDIIKTIDAIAFQTNLLALNAAVEAARAGQLGAGFAVVAGEVRSLAMRAGQAARDTAGLIEGTVQKIRGGVDLVASTNRAFSQVAESSCKIAVLVEEIATDSSEQTQGIEQINMAMAQVDKVSQKSAANTEKMASASEELSAQAENLQGMCLGLVQLVHGSGASSQGRSAMPLGHGTPRVLLPVPGRQ